MTTTDPTIAFYAAAAAQLDDEVFFTLNREPADIADGVATVGAVSRIRFTPGDGTTYDVVLALLGQDEITVAVVGGGCAVFAFDGLYLDPRYVQGKLLAGHLPIGFAVAALIGRAHDAVSATRDRYAQLLDEMSGRLLGAPAVIVIVDSDGD